MAARKEVAAGFIIFRRLQDQIQYLLMQTSYGIHHWTPPKGHLEAGETEMQAAERETEEEAGITVDKLKVHEAFKGELRYEVKGQMKRVVYWLAELKDPQTPVVLSHEHKDFNWYGFDDARRVSEFEDMQKLMDKVKEYVDEL